MAGLAGIADPEVLEGSHMEGKVLVGSLVQVEDTILVERHKACLGTQVLEVHLDPNYLAEEDRMVDTQDVARKEGREEEGHFAAVVDLVDLGGLGEQMEEVGFDAEVSLLVLLGEDETRSAWKINQQAV